MSEVNGKLQLAPPPKKKKKHLRADKGALSSPRLTFWCHASRRQRLVIYTHIKFRIFMFAVILDHILIYKHIRPIYLKELYRNT